MNSVIERREFVYFVNQINTKRPLQIVQRSFVRQLFKSMELES